MVLVWTLNVMISCFNFDRCWRDSWMKCYLIGRRKRAQNYKWKIPTNIMRMNVHIFVVSCCQKCAWHSLNWDIYKICVICAISVHALRLPAPVPNQMEKVATSINYMYCWVIMFQSLLAGTHDSVSVRLTPHFSKVRADRHSSQQPLAQGCCTVTKPPSQICSSCCKNLKIHLFLHYVR